MLLASLFVCALALLLPHSLEVVAAPAATSAHPDNSAAQQQPQREDQRTTIELGEFYFRQAHRYIDEVIARSGVSRSHSNGTASAPSAVTLAAYSALKRAAHYGHPAAQHELATALWHGVFFDLLVPMEPGRALLLDQFAALGGDASAHMALGYRYFRGLGVQQSCDKALLHYEFAANVAAAQIEARGGFPVAGTHSRLSSHTPWSSGEDLELIDFYDSMAMNGDVRSAYALARLFMTGSLHVDQDLPRSAAYLRTAADLGHAPSAGALGFLYARGVGVPRDPVQAVSYLTQGQRKGDATAILGMGYCQAHGIGVERNITMALELFQSLQGKHDEAGYYMAEVFFSPDVVSVAASEVDESMLSTDLPMLPLPLHENMPMMIAISQMYSSAGTKGHVLSLHRLAHLALHLERHKVDKCSAASSFKTIADAGDLVHNLTKAHRLFNAGNLPAALNMFVESAALGYESAQANAAYILSRVFCPSPLPIARGVTDEAEAEGGSFSEAPRSGHTASVDAVTQGVENSRPLVDTEASPIRVPVSGNSATTTGDKAGRVNQEACEVRALALYGLSAGMGNGGSYLKIGDFHYYGKAGLEQDKTEASRYYQAAADLKNTHALFNLGLMHETGDGVERDYPLAKRFFDQAATYDTAAQLPATMARLMLKTHETVCGIFGEAETNAFISSAIATLAKADQYLQVGYHIYRVRTYLVHQWLRFSRSPVFQTGSHLDSRVSSMSRNVQNKLSARLSDLLLHLDAWSMNLPLIRSLRASMDRLAAASQKSTSTSAAQGEAAVSKAPGGTPAASSSQDATGGDTDDQRQQQQRVSAAAARQRAQTELIQRGIIQMAALMVFTIAFLLLVRFRTQRLEQGQPQ